MSGEPVVITGLGPISSVGVGRDEFWSALLDGRDGSSEVSSFDTSGFKIHRACELDDERLLGHVARPASPDDPGRASLLAVEAARLALEDAGFAGPPSGAGVIVGTTGGEIQVLEHMNSARSEGGGEAIPDGEFAKHPCHVISANVANAFGLHGPNLVVPTACAAGNYAVSIARGWVRAGIADVVLAGGCDPLSRVAFTGFARLGAIAPDYCRPFDRDRQGLLIGEGAGMVVVESLRSARSRGARVYAEVAGAGTSCDAHHMTMPQPEGRGIRLAMKRALDDSGLPADAIDYVSAHGTGTKANDKVESAAIRDLFGSADPAPVSSIKSMIGHTMGAASSLETIACCLAIETGSIPPTIHHETPDPECPVDVVPNEARQHRVSVALNNAFAFGGNNSSLVLAAPRS
ncbi:MAG: beta-ketoacyl-[acyl-carrier-protein] synthase family protein [Myxococcota bacterium]|nr:beta-ketoacyl-[acyl-carrier-protein] synthase family protein [Myxococcota bacterium]